VTRFSWSRSWISLFAGSVPEVGTLSVRSNASLPSFTSSRIWIPERTPKPDESRRRRNAARVSSIVRARLISWSRVRSGISPIWVRYMRTGSSIFSLPPVLENFPTPTTTAGSSSSRRRRPSSSISDSSTSSMPFSSSFDSTSSMLSTASSGSSWLSSS
jgi:hypothetical protein